MKYNLIVNYYIDKNPERSSELDFCILENVKNYHLTKILIISSQSHFEHLMRICPEEYKAKIIPVIEDKRPTYNDYFLLIRKNFSELDNINVISNLDVILPAESLLYSTFYLTGNTCLALSRWDVQDRNTYQETSVLFDRPDSQDTWIFKGSVQNIIGADFTLGVAGCDNSIAHLLENSGYDVKNPSRTIKTYHLHLTNIRNYTDLSGQAIYRVPPPYKLIHPTA